MSRTLIDSRPPCGRAYYIENPGVSLPLQRRKRSCRKRKLGEESEYDEMPLTRHNDLYKYWAQVRNHRTMPTRSDIDPANIIRLLPVIALIEQRAEGYFWRLIGTEITEHFGRNLTGERYGSHFSPTSFVDATMASFDMAFEREVPVFDEFVYRSEEGLPHAVSRLICPLAADHTHPPMIIHTRLHRYEHLQAYFVAGQAQGELRSRHFIYSVEDIECQTREWLVRASSIAR